MSASLLIAPLNDTLSVSFDPEAPAEAGMPSGLVFMKANRVGETELPVPFQLVGDGDATADEVLTAIRHALMDNDFQLHATAVKLNQ